MRCFRLLCDAGTACSAREAAAMITSVIKLVASHLGNTPAVCRSSYVHPAILSAYGDGTLRMENEMGDGRLTAEEAQFIGFLEAQGDAQPASSSRA